MEDNRNYADECGDHGGKNSSGNPCGRAAGWGTDFDSGKCRKHRGTSPDGSSHEGNDFAVGNDGGAPDGNDNAVDHGAYREDFLEDFLTDEEGSRVEVVEEILSTPEGSQKHARMMAGVALEQFRRSGNERFLREYRQLCEKARIFPEEETSHRHQHDHSHQHDHELGERERSALDSVTGGPETIEVEAVDTTDTAQDGADDANDDALEIGW